jgi:hypothetical protein
MSIWFIIAVVVGIACGLTSMANGFAGMLAENIRKK